MKTVINFTQQSVIAEIESILHTYPYKPYQQAFAIPELRQELISYIFNRISCFYNATELEQNCSITYKSPRSPLEHQIHLQSLIQQGIYSIMQEKSDWISHHLCEPTQPGCEPSHWFG
ncbi:hypothetical protein [Calothrix sp. 336/3]|uniref:hypothetical protein n=1 Tax=Calothrix sp. 336/3 TaxID=1337936 RepID=UPI0004E2C4BC|nr:hypothetical protein [Calothrix sp. 336/3]AKG22568.1 hypothetical protein IJ00_15990 [Calothrix sp. 336/3]